MKEEEDYHVRRAREARELLNKKAGAVMKIVTMPCIFFLTLGFFWNQLSSPMAFGATMAAIIFSVGAAVATGIKADW